MGRIFFPKIVKYDIVDRFPDILTQLSGGSLEGAVSLTLDGFFKIDTEGF